VSAEKRTNVGVENQQSGVNWQTEREICSGGEIIRRESEYSKGSRIVVGGKNWGILRRRGLIKSMR
jgi:hypothetical protein